jgi:excinuclease UvrABC nuclease subunit
VLPRTSEALKILQNVRDESHRFANKFRTTLQTKDIREAAEAVPRYLEEE